MTASLPQSHHDYTFAEYLTLERDSEIKHEFDAGEILAMSGGTSRHSALAMNVGFALRGTRPDGCTVFQSDMRVRIAATGRATYPDVSMVCGPIEYDPEDAARTTITNPVLIVEVLSVTTEKGDRGNKWMHYQRIPSLQEYVLVSQEPRIEVFRRTPSGTWEYFEMREGNVKLATGPALDFSMLYADLPV
ncbi:MAG TPA: Uma2 family endonuclease [Thermoanaerobaculia bacterium]|jgi:Uma2 family endonuclease|nr:Uma2 family endonuclease [Thermoanaerobaculia bacterium]